MRVVGIIRERLFGAPRESDSDDLAPDTRFAEELSGALDAATRDETNEETSNEHMNTPALYILADHLDAALAAGEDILSLTLPPEADAGRLRHDDLTRREAAFDAFVDALRKGEERIVTHVLQARRQAEEMYRGDIILEMLVPSFVSGTAVLVDAVEMYGDTTNHAFTTGEDRIAYLRARQVIDAQAATVSAFEPLEITESYLLATRIELGMIMDLVATFLDSLDIQYGLYDVAIEDAAEEETTAGKFKPDSLADALARMGIPRESGTRLPPGE